MPLVVKDRVKETTTTTGTGTITLAGAVSGYQSFSVIGNGNTTYYAIVGTTEWEIGIGTYTLSGTTLSRDTVLESSNSGNLVNFSAGSKDVFVTYPAERSLYVDGSSIVPATAATLPLSSGGTGANLTDPNADRILFWDDSAGSVAFLTAGTGITITGTTVTSGDVVGPSSATDNAVVRFDSTTGKLIKNSGVIIANTDAVSGITQLDVDNIQINGNTISSTNANGNILLSAPGTGAVLVTGPESNSTATSVRFTAAGGSGSNYIALKAPDSVASNRTITFPDVTGTILTTGAAVTIAQGGTGQTTAPAANAALTGFTTTATAAGTTTLTNASSYYQIFTGTSTQTVQLPATSTLAQGWSFHIVNNSTGTLTLNTSTSVTLGTIPSGITVMATALTTSGNTATDWEFGYTDFSTITGTGANVLATSPTLTDPVITGTIIEDVFTITDGAAFEVDPANGSVQLITLGANRTPKATNFAAGESVTLMVLDGTAYTLTWTDATWGSGGVVWVGGSAPTLDTTKYTVIQFWKVSTQVYGALVGFA